MNYKSLGVVLGVFLIIAPSAFAKGKPVRSGSCSSGNSKVELVAKLSEQQFMFRVTEAPTVGYGLLMMEDKSQPLSSPSGHIGWTYNAEIFAMIRPGSVGSLIFFDQLKAGGHYQLSMLNMNSCNMYGSYELLDPNVDPIAPAPENNAPTVALTRMFANTYYSTCDIYGLASDDTGFPTELGNKIQVAIDGQALVNMTEHRDRGISSVSSNGNYGVSIAWRTCTPGAHSITVTVEDAVGNQSSTTKTITIPENFANWLSF